MLVSTMTSPVTVTALGSIPIPVGNRVEVRVFLRNLKVWKTKLEPVFDEPFITDLDTGVTYGTHWHFQELTSMGSWTTLPHLPVEPRADLEVHSTTVGTVTATRVATLGFTEKFTQTTLVIAPEKAKSS